MSNNFFSLLTITAIIFSATSACNSNYGNPIPPPSERRLSGPVIKTTSVSFFEDNCQDNIDNNQDGFTDCDDEDCQLDSYCLRNLNTEKNCFDGIDNDLDGHTDCADSDCVSKAKCRPHRNSCRPNPCDIKLSCLADHVTLASTQGICHTNQNIPVCSFENATTTYTNCADTQQVCLSDHCSYTINTLRTLPTGRMKGYLDYATVVAIDRFQNLMMVQQTPQDPAIAISLPIKGGEKLVPGNVISLKFKDLTRKNDLTIINGNKAIVTAIESTIRNLQQFITQVNAVSDKIFTTEDFGKSFAISGILLRPIDSNEQTWAAVYGKNHPIVVKFPPRHLLPILPQPLHHFSTNPLPLHQQNNLPSLNLNAKNFHLEQAATVDEICNAFNDSAVFPTAKAAYVGYPAAITIPLIPLADEIQIALEDENHEILEQSSLLKTDQIFWQSKIGLNKPYRFKISVRRTGCKDITRYTSILEPQAPPQCNPTNLFISQVLDKKCYDRNIRLVELTNSCSEPLALKDWEIRLKNHNLSAHNWNLEQQAKFGDDVVLPPQKSILVGQSKTALSFLSEVAIGLTPYPFAMEGQDIVGLFAPNGTLVDQYGNLDSITDSLSTPAYWDYTKQTAIRRPGYKGHIDFATADSFSQEWQLIPIKCRKEDFATLGSHQL